MCTMLYNTRKFIIKNALYTLFTLFTLFSSYKLLFFIMFFEQGMNRVNKVSSVELIGKLMAGAVGVNFVRGTAGALLSKAELAGLLAGLSQAEMDLALAKYGCDELAHRRLLVHVQAYITAIALKEVWKPRSSELFGSLAVLVISEVVGENICPHCHGTGLVKVRVCHVCNGTRHKAMSGRSIAQVLGLSNTQWLRDWKARYDMVYDYVYGLDSHIKRQIYLSSLEKI